MDLTLLVLQAGSSPSGTGLEWMVLASLAVPALLLVWILYYGGRDDSVY